ncbi:hypothetical protein EW146_g4406 [Bondarzewia mesenterica]|uniref:Uncharacterized protein n=1 Tax=Bondarzewia mesenterica TaxID=1095465 RepID=A0A4S4LWV3_9AGAM|nr:hypothetical protein EW146_g4406 [Bondarzewia mesenterica]
MTTEITDYSDADTDSAEHDSAISISPQLTPLMTTTINMCKTDLIVPEAKEAIDDEEDDKKNDEEDDKKESIKEDMPEVTIS